MITLDTIWKRRNDSEGRYIGRASALGFQDTSENAMRNLCRQMVAEGIRGEAQAFRNEVAVFAEPFDIGDMAAGKHGRGEQPEHLRKKV